MLIDALRQDLLYAVRGLRRSPGLTATILVMFVLGIGVNAAIFTVLDRVFFQAPAGVVDPASVRRLIRFSRDIGNTVYAGDNFTTKDITHFADVAGADAQIEGYDAVTGRRVGDDAQLRTVAYATTGFFRLAGVRPHRGRFFSPDENRFGDPRNVAVLSYAYWQRAFGSDSALLGRGVRIDTAFYTVIGIAPPQFEGMDLDVIDVWVPLASIPAGLEGSPLNGDFDIVQLFARVATGADPRALQARLNVQFRRDRSFVLQRDSTIRLEMAPLLQARSALRLGAQNERNLALLSRLGGVGIVVLVVAVTNVASLLLMRALRRRREIAIRVALGISRRRLGGQLVVESVLLALLGGLVALLIAWWTAGVLRTVLLSNVHWSATVIDRRVVAFTMLAALTAGVAAGLAPASVALRRNLMTALKAGAAESGRRRSFGRAALLVTQTALCMLMLAAAGAFLQSLRRASTVDLGFDAARLITFQLVRIDPGVGDAALARIRALPGVASVSRSDGDIRGGASYAGIWLSNGDSITAFLAPSIGFVDTAFATATGVRLLNGRFFDATDARGSEPVAVINQALANQYWPQRNPIGDCFRVYSASQPCRRIVGVVSATKWNLTAAAPEAYFLPATQSPYPDCCPVISVGTHQRATPAVLAEIRRILSAIPGHDPEYPPNPRLVSERLEPQFRPWRVAAIAFLLCGALALAAAAAGIYGLIGYDVAERTHEFGVRITIGATAADILKLVIASGLRVVGVGLIVGAASAVAGGRLIASLLFETSPYEPTALLATAAALITVALAASLVPGWRATRVDPVVALRAE
jgi:predicted permease